jgi:CHASE2 domain-containing sensor protein
MFVKMWLWRWLIELGMWELVGKGNCGCFCVCVSVVFCEWYAFSYLDFWIASDPPTLPPMTAAEITMMAIVRIQKARRLRPSILFFSLAS